MLRENAVPTTYDGVVVWLGLLACPQLSTPHAGRSSDQRRLEDHAPAQVVKGATHRVGGGCNTQGG